MFLFMKHVIINENNSKRGAFFKAWTLLMCVTMLKKQGFQLIQKRPKKEAIFVSFGEQICNSS